MAGAAGIRTLLGTAALIAGCAAPPNFVDSTARVEAPQVGGSARWTYAEVNPFNGIVTGTLTESAAGKSIGRIPFPLEPGMHWSERQILPQEFGPARVQWVSGRALGWEKVRTPAGEFLALKVIRETSFGDGDYAWTQTQRIEQIWYAPAVGHWVRLERRDERYARTARRGRAIQFDRILWELKDYQPG